MNDFEGEVQEDPCVARLLDAIDAKRSELRQLEGEAFAPPSLMAEAHANLGRLYGTLTLARRIERLRAERAKTLGTLGKLAGSFRIDADDLDAGIQFLGSAINVQVAILQAQEEMRRRDIEGIFEGPDWLPTRSTRVDDWGVLNEG